MGLFGFGKKEEPDYIFLTVYFSGTYSILNELNSCNYIKDKERCTPVELLATASALVAAFYGAKQNMDYKGSVPAKRESELRKEIMYFWSTASDIALQEIEKKTGKKYDTNAWHEKFMQLISDKATKYGEIIQQTIENTLDSSEPPGVKILEVVTLDLYGMLVSDEERGTLLYNTLSNIKK